MLETQKRRNLLGFFRYKDYEWMDWLGDSECEVGNKCFPSTEIERVASPIQTMPLHLEPDGHQISELFRLDDDSKSFPDETKD